MHNFIYIAVMGFSAMLSLLRGFVVAAILPPHLYAIYSSILGMGGFLGNFISFGQVERTVKNFPRLLLGGNEVQVVVDARKIAWVLSYRGVLLSVLSLLIYWLTGADIMWSVSVAAILSLGSAQIGLLASIQRAQFNLKQLMKGTLLRAGISIICVSIAAYHAELNGALFGEWIGAAIGVAVTLWIISQTMNRDASKVILSESMQGIEENKGFRLFLTYTILSVPLYLDRIFLIQLYNEDIVANYSLVALFLTGSVVLVNIISQKVGPNLIGMQKSGATAVSLLSYSGKWIGFCCMVWGVILICLLAGNEVGLLKYIFPTYNVDIYLILSVGVLGFFQFSSIVEFILIAQDKESKLLKHAVLFISILITMSFVFSLVRPPLYFFPLSIALVKGLYIVGLVYESLVPLEK